MKPEEIRCVVGFIWGVADIEKETLNLNLSCDRYNCEILFMQEHRARLTSDIVTGKLDTRTAAAKITDFPHDAVLDTDKLNDSAVDSLEESDA